MERESYHSCIEPPMSISAILYVLFSGESLKLKRSGIAAGARRPGTDVEKQAFQDIGSVFGKEAGRTIPVTGRLRDRVRRYL